VVKRDKLKHIEKRLYKWKIIIIYWARQTWKTTLVKEVIKKHKTDSVYLNCDEIDVRASLESKTSTELKSYIWNKKLVIIDEAQRVKDIWITLKLLVDNYPEIQVIATWSSSFDLSNSIIEPLTWRKYEFYLYPLSVWELLNISNPVEINRKLERFMVYWMYPDVIVNEWAESEEIIKNIAKSYLYKDIFAFQNIKNSEILEKLLQALALQIGSEVSYSELWWLLWIDKNTIKKYIEILEKAFIVYRIPPFSRNIRNELKKMRKIYFYDTWIRNALINNFNPLDLRQDTGALFENFMINEIIKSNANNINYPNYFFWRTHTQQEIDLIVEEKWRLRWLEFKWKNTKIKIPKVFLEKYKNSTIDVVSKENFLNFL
jgi:hypothetical protein